jgi:hypothetical protein
MPDSAHHDIAELLTYLDTARTKFQWGSYKTRHGRLVTANLLLNGQRKPSQLGFKWYFA